jgi:signal peptidase I
MKTKAIYLIIVSGFIIIFNSIFKLDYVPSGSMENTVQTGDSMFTNKLAYTLNNKPQRGDIISFISSDER